ncbi:MAG: hypothetical protein PHP53_03010 [Prolixibacteraceae bacterium]|nr:hypothetical protein [Prolixibacteraceae bacterium]
MNARTISFRPKQVFRFKLGHHSAGFPEQSSIPLPKGKRQWINAKDNPKLLIKELFFAPDLHPNRQFASADG